MKNQTNSKARVHIGTYVLPYQTQSRDSIEISVGDQRGVLRDVGPGLDLLAVGAIERQGTMHLVSLPLARGMGQPDRVRPKEATEIGREIGLILKAKGVEDYVIVVEDPTNPSQRISATCNQCGTLTDWPCGDEAAYRQGIDYELRR